MDALGTRTKIFLQIEKAAQRRIRHKIGESRKPIHTDVLRKKILAAVFTKPPPGTLFCSVLFIDAFTKCTDNH